MHGGDLMCVSAILLSGSNFKKISMFSKFLQLSILSQTTFSKIQRTYLVPSIDQYWVEHQDGILKLLIGKYVIILGTIFNKTRIWCKCTRTKVHMKLFSSVDKIMEKCFFPVIHHLAVTIKAKFIPAEWFNNFCLRKKCRIR